MSAGYTQETLAAKLGFDRTVVGKAETGERPPTTEVLSLWCEACQLDEGIFVRLASLARSVDGPVPSWFESWLEAEQ
jgi:transcriptional regulator with XRE-family HTH domain